jgi:two-component system CheB/CheR fusion protein
VPLEAVLSTAELDRRGARPADYEAENRALTALMQELTDPRGDVLHKLAEAALRLCAAHSAGVSILEEEGGRQIFRWRAAAGRLSALLGGTMPRADSPCGTVLDRDSVLLLSHPERHYPIPPAVAPPVVEVLLVPFHAAGEPVGTVWVIAHDEGRRFDGEDRRLMRSLGHFASLAHQVAAAHRLQARAAEQLTADLSATQRLQEISTRLIQAGDEDALYQHFLDAAVAIMRAEFASMQLLDPARGELRLLAYRGFDPATVAFWEWVRPASGCTCGAALRAGRRVVVPDVEACEFMAGTNDLAAYRRAGIRAVQTTPLFSRGGRLLGMISTHWRNPHEPSDRDLRLLDVLARQAADLVERALSEKVLRDSEELFRTLADNISQLAWSCNELGFGTWYNRRWYDYTGTTFQTMRGDGWKTLHHPDHLDRVVQGLRRSAEAGEPWEDTFPLRGKDGNYRWFLSRAVPIRDAAGNIVRWFGTNTDITEQRAAEEALKESDRRKDEFLATLAHELRNPLAPIRNGLQIMRLARDDPEAVEQARGMMERQLGHMVRLIEDLLDVSRISQGKVELRRQRVELAAAVRGAVETSLPLVEAGGHDLRIDVPPEPIYVDGDVTRLAQVFANLLNNAAKYTERGGRISLTVRRQGGDVAVAVKDNGVGIAAPMLPRIFDLFAQADRSLEKAQGGLGLGLNIVRRLVTMHGGTVEVRSDGPGTGSEFVVRLPAAPAIAAGPRPAGAGAPAGAGRRVLVVDDNKDAAASLATLLRIMGHDTRAACDGLEALDVAAAFRPDVILLDIGMPKLNGYDTAGRIRQQPWGKDVVLIALTGWGQEADRCRSREAGFNHHLVKPVEPSALEALLAASQQATA